MRKVDQAKYDERRQQILKAAEGCFRRDGLRGASIDAICTAAHMSPGHLYHYFDSKEAIIEAIFESHQKREAAAFAELKSEEDLVTAMSEWLDRRLKNTRANISLSLELRAESARNPAIARIVNRADRGVRELLSRLICEGQARGQIDPGLDPEIVAAVLHSIIFGLNRLGTISDSTFDTEAASAMLNLLMERFLRPQKIQSTRRVRHTKRETDGKMPR